MAPCLTPGCAKYGFHIGPCTQDEMIEQGCKRSRSTVPRYEAGAAPPPSLLHAVVARRGVLPSDVSCSPRTEPPRKPEPRVSMPRPSRKLQYPSKEDDGENENDDDEEEEEEGDDDSFNWVFVALMSDGTLRQYTNEMMDEELYVANTFPVFHFELSIREEHGGAIESKCHGQACFLPCPFCVAHSARLKLGYLVQAEFLDDPPDT